MPQFCDVAKWTGPTAPAKPKRRSHAGRSPRTGGSAVRHPPFSSSILLRHWQRQGCGSHRIPLYHTLNWRAIATGCEKGRTDRTGSEARFGYDASVATASKEAAIGIPTHPSVSANCPALSAQRATVRSARPEIGRWSATAAAPGLDRSGLPLGPRR